MRRSCLFFAHTCSLSYQDLERQPTEKKRSFDEADVLFLLLFLIGEKETINIIFNFFFSYTTKIITSLLLRFIFTKFIYLLKSKRGNKIQKMTTFLICYLHAEMLIDSPFPRGNYKKTSLSTLHI